MVKIPFKYKVVSKNREENTMEVLYSTEYPDVPEDMRQILVGTVWPKTSVDLHEFFLSYAPYHLWESYVVGFADVDDDFSGEYTPPPAELPKIDISQHSEEDIQKFIAELRS